MLQTLQVTGYTCNKLRLLSQNILEDVELPVRVENRRCSCCLIVDVNMVTSQHEQFH